MVDYIDMPGRESPLVSVTVISFNQREYIGECIESILAQRVDFGYEIVIGDDGSTDGTKDIIRGYAERHAEIRFIDRPVNIGLQRNIADVIGQCRGKYVALLEGDDYWTDRDKLQVQADFLECHDNCSVVFTDSLTFQGTDLSNGKRSNQKIDMTESETFIFNLQYYLSTYSISIPNNTKMFRKSAHPAVLPYIFFESVQWDWILHLLHGLHGDFAYLRKVTLAYRRHANAIITPKNNERILLDAIRLVHNVNQILPIEYHRYFVQPLFEMNSLAFHYLAEGKLSAFIVWYTRWLWHSKALGINIRDEAYKLRRSLKSAIQRTS